MLKKIHSLFIIFALTLVFSSCTSTVRELDTPNEDGLTDVQKQELNLIFLLVLSEKVECDSSSIDEGGNVMMTNCSAGPGVYCSDLKTSIAGTLEDIAENVLLLSGNIKISDSLIFTPELECTFNVIINQDLGSLEGVLCGEEVTLLVDDIEALLGSSNLCSVVAIPECENKGPAGGCIFYDKGNDEGGWRYLEAAIEDIGTHADTVVWATDLSATLVTGQAIGKGDNNTELIISALGEDHNGGNYAAKKCADLVAGGFDDWFLPTKDELNEMYVNLHLQGFGGFADFNYWSSSESEGSSDHAWMQVFADGYEGAQYASNKDDTDKIVRCIRAF